MELVYIGNQKDGMVEDKGQYTDIHKLQRCGNNFNSQLLRIQGLRLKLYMY